MKRLALQALGLSIVIPMLAVLYLFREDLAGKELPLILLAALAGLGFSILWGIIRAIGSVQRGLARISRGESHSLEVSGPSELHEIAGIFTSLNKVTADFRDNANQLEGFLKQFASVTELAQLTAKVPDLRKLLSLVLQKSMAVTHAKRGTVMVLREDEDVFDVMATEGWTIDSDEPISLDETLVKKVVETGDAMLIEDIDQAPDLERPNDPKYSSPSFLVMPLRTRSKIVGVVCLAEKANGQSFSANDQQFLNVLLGQVGFAVENTRILTHAREAADRLRRMKQNQEAHLRGAQLDALGQLAGGIAHDFNNLVQTILGYTRFAQEGLSPEHKRYRDLQQVERAARRAASLTQQLQAFGRRQMLQPIDLDLNDLIEDLAMMLSRIIGDHVEIKIVGGEDLATVHADPQQIEQVLTNLCVNARDAMTRGGTITIETRNVVLDEHRCETLPGARPGPYVRVSISDTGMGMDEETQRHVFEPFFTTKKVGRGSGLGLATAYGIVKQHNGGIYVISEPDLGTTFSVYLPMVNRPAVRKEAAATAAVSGGTETILVAEDEETVRELSTRILEGAGYRVLTATDGADAVKVFEANSETISLALVDAVMPRLSGHEVCDRIRSLKPEVRLVLTSGYSADAVEGDPAERAPLHLIQKPFDPSDLLRKVRDILDEAA